MTSVSSINPKIPGQAGVLTGSRQQGDGYSKVTSAPLSTKLAVKRRNINAECGGCTAFLVQPALPLHRDDDGGLETGFRRFCCYLGNSARPARVPFKSVALSESLETASLQRWGVIGLTFGALKVPATTSMSGCGSATTCGPWPPVQTTVVTRAPAGAPSPPWLAKPSIRSFSRIRAIYFPSCSTQIAPRNGGGSAAMKS